MASDVWHHLLQFIFQQSLATSNGSGKRAARYVECSITLIRLFVEYEHNKSAMPKTLGPLMMCGFLHINLPWKQYSRSIMLWVHLLKPNGGEAELICVIIKINKSYKWRGKKSLCSSKTFWQSHTEQKALGQPLAQLLHSWNSFPVLLRTAASDLVPMFE